MKRDWREAARDAGLNVNESELVESEGEVLAPLTLTLPFAAARMAELLGGRTQ